MPTLDFSLRLISPAFVAGAMEKDAVTELRNKDGNVPKHRLIGDDGDSLRVPTLRGVLRFWFRTKEDGSDPQAVATNEAKIFGSTEAGQGIRFIPAGQSSWQPAELGTPDEFVRAGGAEAYLGYGPLNYVSKEKGVSSHNKSVFRDAIPEGTIFHFRAVGNDQQLQELKKCLLLLHLFGGVGSRSRRAWGSVAVIGGFIPVLQKDETINAWFERTLALVWLSPYQPSKNSAMPLFSSFSTHTLIRISKSPQADYKKVMTEFHGQFKKTRLYNINDPGSSPLIAQQDHDWEARDSVGNDVKDVPLRLAFGMPYAPSSRRNNWGIAYKGFSPNQNGSEIDRRASPLFLKVFQGPDQKLYAVSLFLKAEFFGDKQLEIGKEPKGKKKPFPGWKAVEDFMTNSNWQTVKLP